MADKVKLLDDAVTQGFHNAGWPRPGLKDLGYWAKVYLHEYACALFDFRHTVRGRIFFAAWIMVLVVWFLICSAHVV